LRGTWVDTEICPTDEATSLDLKLLTVQSPRAEGFEIDIMKMV
jgi:hypothetical protein